MIFNLEYLFPILLIYTLTIKNRINKHKRIGINPKIQGTLLRSQFSTANNNHTGIIINHLYVVRAEYRQAYPEYKIIIHIPYFFTYLMDVP